MYKQLSECVFDIRKISERENMEKGKIESYGVYVGYELLGVFAHKIDAKDFAGNYSLKNPTVEWVGVKRLRS